LRQIKLDQRVWRNHAVGGTDNRLVAQEVKEAMIAIIVIALLALIGAVFTFYARQRRSFDKSEQPVIPAPHFEGLFDHSDATLSREAKQLTLESERQTVLDLAKNGDVNALTRAHSAKDAELYAAALDALVERASGRQEALAALVSQVSKSNGLRANKQLAQLLIETWKAAPNRRSTIEMIHIAALSDDAEIYEQALEAALDLWRSGRLTGFRSDELSELFVSQYWVIAPEVRQGGRGFALKRRLLSVRRELAAATPNR
jgi:hypothetical protein